MNLDPIRTENTLAAGARIWAEAHDGAPEMRDKIVVLLAEAAETQRALRSSRPTGYASGWPDYVMTGAEIIAVENERNTLVREAEKIGLTPDMLLHEIGSAAKPGASAARLARYMEVTQWLRLIKSKRIDQKSLRMRLLLAMAGGLSCRKAADSDHFSALGITTRQGMEYFKASALTNIEEGLRRVIQRKEESFPHFGRAS